MEIVHRAVGEVKIGEERRRRQGVFRDADQPVVWQKQRRGGEHAQDCQQAVGQQPLDAVGPEPVETDAPVPFQLAQQQPGDEESRQDEEDIDPDKAAWHAGNAKMVADDRQNGHGAQTL